MIAVMHDGGEWVRPSVVLWGSGCDKFGDLGEQGELVAPIGCSRRALVRGCYSFFFV